MTPLSTGHHQGISRGPADQIPGGSATTHSIGDSSEIQDVYNQPTSAYNLISCSQLEVAGHDVMFRQRQIIGQDSAIELTRTGSMHAIQEVDHNTKDCIFHEDTRYAGAHNGKMRADEWWHRRRGPHAHVRGYGKLKRASTINLPGMSSFWISALKTAADTLNVTSHKALGPGVYDTSFHAHYGYHADIRQCRPLGYS